MKIAIGSDHAGWLHKEYIKKNLSMYGYTVIDSNSKIAKTIINYPDMVHPIATLVKEKQVEFGVVLCGSGNGAANILSIPARFIISLDIIVSFLKTSFEGGRHIMRIQKIVIN